ncbi:MAG TPA: serine hydrolase domain-containing protein [Thermoanaerobaculia bacterium]|jgi:CubicO group peptidase (beta-lactamase class C family)
MRALLLISALLPAFLARADAVDEYVQERMRQLRLPGVAVAIVRDGQPADIRAYGLADLENEVPVTAETVFELGSVTKQFTATAVMILAEEGKLALDKPARAYLPELPPSWQDITVRHLLTHSSGIQEYLSVKGLPDEAHALDHRAMTRLFAARVKREFAAGDTWAYSNTGYLLLGDIIERVSGTSYWTFLDERLFRPAGMTHTRSSAPQALIRRRASGYGWRDGAFENRPALSENAYSAGAIASTIADMAKWEAAMQKGALLSPAGWRALWTPLRLSSGGAPPLNYAFGWVADRERGRRAVLHSGGTPGFSSAIRRYADDGLAVIVLANHGDRILDHMPLEIAGLVHPAVARRRAAESEPERSRVVNAALRGLLSGTPDLTLFTPEMRLFLGTATGKGLWEWVASHGDLKALAYHQTETADGLQTLRYRATLGEAELWLSFAFTEDGKLAQVYWW